MKLLSNQFIHLPLRKLALFLSLSALTLTACGDDTVSANSGDKLLAERPALAVEPSLVVASWSGINASAQAETTAPEQPADKAVSLVDKIRAMAPNTGLLLPSPSVIALDADLANGPPSRDYSNRMVYSPKRQTALYIGAGHNNHRRNDVWEFHLGSNTWQQLFPSDGGSHKPLNALLYHVLRQEKEIAATGLSPKQQRIVEAARQWWQANAQFKDGRITTRFGGPILPFHTWDALVFDESVGKLFWAVGANWLPIAKAQTLLGKEPLDKVESKLDSGLSTMWSFDPATQQYDQLPKPGASGPELRGMGSSMIYMPDKQKSLYYVAATNVTPGEFGMYLFDARQGSWEELKPNGGQSVRDLAIKAKESPRSEAQMAYSSKHQLVFAVLNNDSFLYDVEQNYWERLPADERIVGHDARSVLVYDEAAEVFLLANPGNEAAPLAEFDPRTRRWTVLQTSGDNLVPEKKQYGLIGYYDPTFQRMVVRYGRDRLWVYRR